MLSINNLISKLLEASGGNERNAGKLFERFVKTFLKTHNYWGKKFRHIWSWSEYPDRGNRVDTGIDLVGEDFEGNRWAIQTKFYKSSKISHESIAKFIASSPSDEFKYRLFVYMGELTKNAEETLKRNKVYVINIEDELEIIDWNKFDWSKPEEIVYKEKKKLRPYQQKALEKVIEGFKKYDRGKLIMPPGSGKTFVALKIAEKVVGRGGYVLFLVPSIALADQTLRAWLEDSDVPIRPFAVTSDVSVGRVEDSVEKTTLLTIPPTTDAQKLTEVASEPDPEKMTVIVSTYQSIDVISEAQKLGLPEFDLIICDEAHYTTGLGDRNDLSPFKKVHKNEYVKGKKRLYMTATPKVFSVAIKEKAKEADLEIYDMSDEDVYGPTFFHYKFYDAVQEGFLTDYKVVVLTVSEREVQEKLYEYLNEGYLNVEDTAKMVGIIKAFEGNIKGEKIEVNIKRAVIFCSSIQRSKKVSSELQKVAKELNSSLNVAPFHIDGNMSASERKRLLDWLRAGPQGSEDVRVLTNARVLTEGIDVPALDSVVFLDPRKSIVDIVQAMGRVMRKAPGKKYGYIVIPVVVSEDKDIEEQLEGNKFRTIWQVVGGLRSLDESLPARVRQIMISQSSYREVQEGPGGIEGEVRYDRERATVEWSADSVLMMEFSEAIPPDLREKLKKAIVPKIVEKVGGKKYLETWAKDVAKRVRRILRHVNEAIKRDQAIRNDFEKFLNALRQVINPAITEEEAKSMLVQHMITKPIFDAIFEGYEFLKDNPVAQTIEKLSSHFTKFIEAETEDLEEFYREVRIRVKGIDKEAERQDFLRQLYDCFFKLAFPDVADRLGIVYTPVELVDFLIKSVEDILQNEFNSSLNDENVVILEPFVGTGTFLTRLISFLDTDALKRKYSSGEIWGNEILLLPYYIALTNIESTYFDKTGEYQPFKYLLLTDTFELDEKRRKGHQLTFGFFPQSYTELMEKENKARINVIISNPPWRAGQEDMTDLNMSLKYENLDRRIKQTYADRSKAKLKNALYDSYVRAIRYASDRIGDRGVVAFVLNNGFIDSNSFDGFRKSLAEEFKKIYVFNLRGNARTQGEEWKKEGDKIFGQGSRAGVALLILVKDKKDRNEPAEIYYYQVEDYLKRHRKLELLKEFGSVKNVPWQKIVPDEDGNWINQGSEEFKEFIRVEDIFEVIRPGLATAKDFWVYDFSKGKLHEKMKRFVEEYNKHVRLVKEGKIKKKEDLSTDKTKISWSESLIKAVFSRDAEEVSFETAGEIRKAVYRPFVDMRLYFSTLFNERAGAFLQILPTEDAENRIISFTAPGSGREFSAIVTNKITDQHIFASVSCISLYIYISLEDAKKKAQQTLFSSVLSKFYRTVKLGDKTYGRRLNIKYKFYEKLKDHFKTDIEPEDIFYYVYAVLSNPEYGKKYANDLRRERPRIPMPKDLETFNKLVEIGKRLADLHVNYENAPEYPLEVEIRGDRNKLETYFPDIRIDKDNPSVIRYNEYITIRGIPEEAYEWKIAGRSPLEWIAEYVRPRKHKDSGIVIDPADYIKETGDREYFIRLIKKVVKVSLETQKIFKELENLLTGAKTVNV